MKPRSEPPIVVGNWTIYAHPLLLDQLDRLIRAVETARTKNPTGYKAGADAKLLAALTHLIFSDIPGDPTRAKYRQGGTLGAGRKHWFRERFFQRYRLFFRYHSEAKIIIFAWVNDADTLRKAGARTDPYAVFASMLARDTPPDSWDALLAQCRTPAATRRLSRMRTGPRQKDAR